MNKLFRVLISSMFLSLCNCSHVIAITPEIQDGPSHISSSQDATIYGANFGSHKDFNPDSPYLNYRFENLEKGYVTKSGYNSFISGGAKFIRTENKANSTACLEHSKGSGEYINAFGEKSTATNRYAIRQKVPGDKNTEYFTSMWIKYPLTFDNISEEKGAQIKIMMMTPLDSKGKTYNQVYPWYGKAYFRTNKEDGDLGNRTGAMESYFPYGTWGRLSIHSNPDPVSGFVRFYINGKLIDSDNYNSSVAGYFTQVGFGAYFKNLNEKIYTDDHFINFTEARIEIGNEDTYNSSNHLEIQLPKIWTETEIKFETNIGSFKPGQKVFIYVTDENGLVNKYGLPVVIDKNMALQIPPQPDSAWIN